MLREHGPASVTLLACEAVLNEQTGGVSTIRIMDVLTLGMSMAARFFVLTYLHSRTVDFGQHVAKLQMFGLRSGNWAVVADAPAHTFTYSYAATPNAPGAFMLTTEFNLDLRTFGELGTFWIRLSVDGDDLEQTPITLRR